VHVAILGAGLSGLGMAVRLKETGLASFTVLEKADAVGGTWRDNTYPGVACDVPSHLYSFSFALNPDWSRVFSPGREIWDYCERIVARYGLREHIRLRTEVARVDFDDVRGDWRITTAAGDVLRADVVVSALGGLHKPCTPEFPGAASFAGTTFHSARWNHAHDLRGRRVAVVGSAASAIQLIPQIAPVVDRLVVFQRTPNWIVPRWDRAYGERTKRLFRRVPALMRLHRWLIYALLESRFPAFLQGSRLTRFVERQCRRHLEAQVPDPELRRRLTPDYPPGCKRLLISDDFYPALGRDDVTLVTSPIARLVPDGVETRDGAHHAVDTIVYATGFEPFNFLSPLAVTGRDGRALADTWRDGVEAHRTVAVPGFPNFFMLLGPNSGLGHNSVIVMIEAQVAYVLGCLRALRGRRLRWIDPLPAASARFNAGLQDAMRRTIWQAGCKSWYMDERGRVFVLWPHSTIRYWWQMRRPALDEYAGFPA
jgi:cation diffusion facilitator CzcD-associated flavoprotein CzcO